MRLFDAELYCEDDFDPRPYQTCVDITSGAYLLNEMLKAHLSRKHRPIVEEGVWKQYAQTIVVSRELLEDNGCPT